MIEEKILRRIQALLVLAERGGTKAEGKAAEAMAAKLMAQYHLTTEDILSNDQRLRAEQQESEPKTDWRWHDPNPAWQRPTERQASQQSADRRVPRHTIRWSEHQSTLIWFAAIAVSILVLTGVAAYRSLAQSGEDGYVVSDQTEGSHSRSIVIVGRPDTVPEGAPVYVFVDPLLPEGQLLRSRLSEAQLNEGGSLKNLVEGANLPTMPAIPDGR